MANILAAIQARLADGVLSRGEIDELLDEAARDGGVEPDELEQIVRALEQTPDSYGPEHRAHLHVRLKARQAEPALVALGNSILRRVGSHRLTEQVTRLQLFLDDVAAARDRLLASPSTAAAAELHAAKVRLQESLQRLEPGALEATFAALPEPARAQWRKLRDARELGDLPFPALTGRTASFAGLALHEPADWRFDSAAWRLELPAGTRLTGLGRAGEVTLRGERLELPSGVTASGELRVVDGDPHFAPGTQLTVAGLPLRAVEEARVRFANGALIGGPGLAFTLPMIDAPPHLSRRAVTFQLTGSTLPDGTQVHRASGQLQVVMDGDTPVGVARGSIALRPGAMLALDAGPEPRAIVGRAGSAGRLERGTAVTQDGRTLGLRGDARATLDGVTFSTRGDDLVRYELERPGVHRFGRGATVEATTAGAQVTLKGADLRVNLAGGRVANVSGGVVVKDGALREILPGSVVRLPELEITTTDQPLALERHATRSYLALDGDRLSASGRGFSLAGVPGSRVMPAGYDAARKMPSVFRIEMGAGSVALGRRPDGSVDAKVSGGVELITGPITYKPGAAPNKGEALVAGPTLHVREGSVVRTLEPGLGAPAAAAPQSFPVISKAEAKARARDVLAYIREQAKAHARQPLALDPDSPYVRRLRDHYLAEYLANPSPDAGKAAIERIGARLLEPTGTNDHWEQWAAWYWNEVGLPDSFRWLRPELPNPLSCATELLSLYNRKHLPLIDVPYLLGKVNTDPAMDSDVRRGGKNVSHLLHWGTGLKHAGVDATAMRELFLAYEIWHLEGWDSFWEDPLNDLLVEDAGRILGAQLLRGEITEQNLLPKLEGGMAEARAWVGTLLRARQHELDGFALRDKRTERPASGHQAEDLWGAETITSRLQAGASMDEVKSWETTRRLIAVYSMIEFANAWERKHGKIPSSNFLDNLVHGHFDDVLHRIANNQPVSNVDKANALWLFYLPGVGKPAKAIRPPQ